MSATMSLNRAVRGAARRVAEALPADRRRALSVELIRVVAASSAPEDRAALHRSLAGVAASWPIASKEEEIHAAGLYFAVRDTSAVAGAIVECGVGRGKSLVSLARAAELFCPHKAVFGFDSFRGFPDAVDADLGTRVVEAGTKPSGWTDTSTELIGSLLDAPASLVPGFFDETLPRATPDQISLLHIDCDLYASTATVLAACVPRLAPGAMVLFDEYQDERWPGATKAIDEVFTADQISWEPYLSRHVVRVPR